MNPLQHLEADLLIRREQVGRLSADQAVGADRVREQGVDARSQRRVVAARDRAEGDVESPNAARIAIASPNTTWLAGLPPHRGIVHCRQIVEDQRGRMDHFHGACGGERAPESAATQLRR